MHEAGAMKGWLVGVIIINNGPEGIRGRVIVSGCQN